MRTSISLMLAATLVASTLVACGDDGGGTGGGGGAGGAGSGGATSTTTTTTATTTTTTGQGGDTGTTTGQGGDTGTTTGQGGGGQGGGAVGEFLPLWENVAYPDDGGRLDIEEFSGLTAQVRVAGTEDVALELTDVTAPAGAVAHLYAIGLVGDGSLDAFLVNDLEEVPTLDVGEGGLRLAHFAPDAPAVDVFLIDADGNAIGPFFDSDQFFYPAISLYFTGPEGVYDAAIVLPGDPVESAIAVFEGVEVIADEYATVAAIGTIGNDDLDLAEYLDDLAAPDDGFAGLTFVHAASDAPNVDVGVLLP